MKIKKLKSVIIDGSQTQRVLLMKIIEEHPELVLDGCYRNAIEAKLKGLDNSADLIFLDIEMPLINGFDFLDSFDGSPQVIIVSNSSEYALKAFDYEVTDYLLKPIDIQRLKKAIRKAIRHREASMENESQGEHLFVKSNFRKVKVNYYDIKWVEALGDYVRLETCKSNLIVLSSMKAFQEKLPKDQFLRIHKSYIINLNRIDQFNNTVVEVDGKTMPLS
ncbi:MAG: response regulator transcription factor, partial [Pricia sp.]|nr:response regulator transcription factor [Pricia sp.]